MSNNVRSMSKYRYSKRGNSSKSLSTKLERDRRESAMEKYFSGVRFYYDMLEMEPELVEPEPDE